MVLATGYEQLNILQVLRESDSYNEYVVETLGSFNGDYRLVWMVKDHNMASRLVKMLHEIKLCSIFSSDGSTCFSFPYEQSRPIERFYYKNAFKREDKNSVIRAVVVLCMTEKLPESILYRLLSEKQIMLNKDKSVYFNYAVELENIDEKHTEAECVMKCASLIIDLLDTDDKQDKVSRELILKKYLRNEYRRWVDLYRDIKLVTVNLKKKSIKDEVKKVAVSKKELFVRILVTVCLILVALTLLVILSQIITGRTPLFNLFTRSFETIGTESLLK
ncbi:MAG: hypothetical protein K6G84_07105 [Lachnospiraceae bacterium]|nr:hypothetical protein [Lachnospiraceae bacterium]